MRAMLLAAAVVLMPMGFSRGARADILRPFDTFGDLNCEDEMARLDNLAVQLLKDPTLKATIIFHGGRLFRGKLPKRGEATARAARLKPYLINRRGVPAAQIEVLNGGYAEEWQVVIFIGPRFAEKSWSPTVTVKQIRFRKGKLTPRDYRCEI